MHNSAEFISEIFVTIRPSSLEGGFSFAMGDDMSKPYLGHVQSVVLSESSFSGLKVKWET